MKRTENINLGGNAYIIDQDALDHLEDYLEDLEKYFQSHEGSDDIMDDIEFRISELLEEQLKNKGVVEMTHVNNIISIMGSVDDLKDGEHSESDHATKKEYKTGKKLYRDKENNMIGGVASGMAAYLGIANPNWVRAFFIVTFWSGLPMLVYFLLWFLIPEARTASDRLAMQGEPINVESIVKNIEEEFYDLKDRFDEFGKEFKSKKKNKLSSK